MADKLFFTIKFIGVNAGLSDMLVRLYSMYKVGKVLSYTYIHTPFICKRSYPLNYIDRIVKKIIGDKIYHPLSKFIGLEKCDLNIFDKDFLHYNIVELNIEDILENEHISSISDLKNIIESNEHKTEPTIYSFLTTGNFYKFDTQSKINNLLQDTVSIKDFRNLVTKRYWQARKRWPISIPFDETKTKILIHVRRGDRACINLGERVICLHGAKVAIVNDVDNIVERAKELLETENFKRPSAASKIALILQKIFDSHGESNFSVIIVSDGYDRTFKVIKSNIDKGHLNLSKSELNQLAIAKKVCRKEFLGLSEYRNVSTIIGESKINFFKSVHAIASADVVIKTSGGFASVLHKFFKKSDLPPIIIDTEQYEQQSFQQVLNDIGQLINKN